MVIASHFGGRVRIRDDSLKREPMIARASEALMNMPGVTGVEGNPRVGSLLVLYSAAVTGVDRIIEAAADLLSSGEVEGESTEAGRVSSCALFRIPARVKRNIANLGMLASLVLSVAAAIFDLKKLHILAGIIFLALFGVHVFERKEYVYV
ncbi:hypothetical protein [Geobacter sp. DSM 9736]|uniref:hypothetical protein n=1 Tax=Geobacter sp. DSM 9736 TaxID=1277350 RepID=UPI000B50C22F|nr:hypothetical protein [Geobacter sp. DSM 9736]SNB45504.1 hypothetical protein SAMN06269301_0922 [Geobacter sp. DSM 9736]